MQGQRDATAAGGKKTINAPAETQSITAANRDLREVKRDGDAGRFAGREGNDVAMTKSELIQHIADLNPHLYHRDVERIVTTIFDEISEALSRGDRVELRGFGAFSVKRREARIGRNPRTGTAVNVSEKHVPFFKTGKQLRERLNNR